MIYANILQQREQVLEKDQLRVNYQGGGVDGILTSALVEGPLYTSFAEQQGIIANAVTSPTQQAAPVVELPTVTTDSATGRSGVPGITATGSVTMAGSSPILQRGFVCNTTGAPTLADTVYTDSATDLGQFTANLATGYGTFYVAAYATTDVGAVYGDSLYVFTQPPTLLTNSAIGSADGTVTASGTVTAQGSSAVTDRGFVWATAGTPTLADSVSHASAAGTGSYINTISTGYGTFYIAAYATNAAGTIYGSTVTAQAIQPLAPSLTTTSVTNNEDGTVTASATLTSAGTAAITSRGFVWGLTSPPTDTVVTVAGVSLGSYSTTIATTDGTFYVAAYATNSVGTTYGESIEVTVTG